MISNYLLVHNIIININLDIIETTKQTSNSKSNGGTAAGMLIGVLAVVVLVAATLYILKKKGKINSYLPTFLSKKSFNTEMAYAKHEDSDLVSMRNKNFN
jgi:hypothetical protein